MNKLIHHQREFLVKASQYAKHMRLKELNSLEGDIMLAEHLLDELKENNYPEHLMMDYGVQIKTIRKIIKEKKVKIL